MVDEKKITQRAAKVNKRDRDAINYFVTMLTKQFIKTLEKSPGIASNVKTVCVDAMNVNLEMIQRNLK